MTRLVRPDDAGAIAAIYAPIVRDTWISFDEEPPDEAAMRAQIATSSGRYPWLVAEDVTVLGYAYATSHRVRAAYRWSVDVSVYLHEHARERGVGRGLYARLLTLLAAQGFHRAYAGIALPNDASIGLHRAMGFVHNATYREVGFKHGAWHDTVWLERDLSPSLPPGEPLAVAALPAHLTAAQPLVIRPA